MKHRTKIEIRRMILELANGQDLKKIKIMNKANLSYKQLKDHLTFLTERDLIGYNEETQTFRTTVRGLKFLQLYKEIDDMVNKLPLALQQHR